MAASIVTCNWLRERARLRPMIVANWSIYITRKTRMRTRASCLRSKRTRNEEERREGPGNVRRWKIALTSGHRGPRVQPTFLLRLILRLHPSQASVSIFKTTIHSRYLLSEIHTLWHESQSSPLIWCRCCFSIAPRFKASSAAFATFLIVVDLWTMQYTRISNITPRL